MGRGSQLYKKIFIKDKESTGRKCRNAELYIKRNELLIARFFYYGQFTNTRYEKILDILSEEFFLTTNTIPRVIQSNQDMLTVLVKAKPVKSFFTKKWPHLNW